MHGADIPHGLNKIVQTNLVTGCIAISRNSEWTHLLHALVACSVLTVDECKF